MVFVIKDIRNGKEHGFYTSVQEAEKAADKTNFFVYRKMDLVYGLSGLPSWIQVSGPYYVKEKS